MPDNAQTTALLAIANDASAPMVLRASQIPIPEGATGMALEDIEECNFAGYAPRTLNDFGGTENEYEDIGEVLTEECVFTASDPLPFPQTIYFFYVTRHHTGSPVELMQVINLPVPQEIYVPNQEVRLQVRIMGAGLV